MRKHLLVTLLLVVGTGLVASTADARISRKLAEELTGHLEALSSETDNEAQQAVALARGLVQGKKGREALLEKRKSENRGVRVAAGMASMLAGDRKADEFVVKELVADAALLRTLEERVSVLPDATESKVLKGLVESGKPEALVAVARYTSTQAGDTEIFGVFASMLTSKDGKVQKPAIDAAMYNRNPAVLAPASKMLASKDESTRVAAVKIAIGITERFGVSEAAQKLLEDALTNSSRKVWEPAARRLVELRVPAGSEKLLSEVSKLEDAADRRDILNFLVAHDVRPKIDQLNDLLEAKDATERSFAYKLAASTGDADFKKKLFKEEQSTEFDERLTAVSALGYTRDEAAAKVLARTLFERRTDMRLATAESIEALGKESTVEALQRALRAERDPKVKLAVIEALGSIKSEKSLRALRFLVTDRDPKVKTATLKSINRIGLEEGASALDVLLRDRNLEIQWLAFLTALKLKPSMAMANIKTALRNPPDGYLADVAKLDKATRDKVFEYILTETTGTEQSEAIRYSIRNGGYKATLLQLMLAPGTASGDRRALMLHFADEENPRGRAVMEQLVRKAPEKGLKHLAAWLLTRSDNKSLEPSYRGYLGMKDPAIRAVATYGIAVIHD